LETSLDLEIFRNRGFQPGRVDLEIFRNRGFQPGRAIPDIVKLLERCHGGTRWAHGYGAQGTREWVRDTRRWRRTLNDR